MPRLAEDPVISWPLRLSRVRSFVVPATVEGPQVRMYQEQFARFLGLEPVYHAPALYLNESEKEEGRIYVQRRHGLDRVPVFLAYDAGAPDKLLPVAATAELADSLAERGAEVHLLRGVGNPYHADAIVNRARARLHLVEGQTLRRVMAILSACRLCLSPDSGVGHIAAALEVPTIIVFGPTSLNFRPLENHVHAVSTAARCPYKKGPAEAACEHSDSGPGRTGKAGAKRRGPASSPRRCIHPDHGAEAAACMYWFGARELDAALTALNLNNDLV
jgi:ADP-heptose:LPS heptosyltransferase